MMRQLRASARCLALQGIFKTAHVLHEDQNLDGITECLDELMRQQMMEHSNQMWGLGQRCKRCKARLCVWWLQAPEWHHRLP